MAKRNPAASEQRPEDDDGANWELEEPEYLDIFPDLGQDRETLYCRDCACAVDPEDSGGYAVCNDCSFKNRRYSMSDTTPAWRLHVIDRDGMIFSGWPDDPESEFHLTDLPIWQDHPQKDNYQRFPASKFLEQMELHGHLRKNPNSNIRMSASFA